MFPIVRSAGEKCISENASCENNLLDFRILRYTIPPSGGGDQDSTNFASVLVWLVERRKGEGVPERQPGSVMHHTRCRVFSSMGGAYEMPLTFGCLPVPLLRPAEGLRRGFALWPQLWPPDSPGGRVLLPGVAQYSGSQFSSLLWGRRAQFLRQCIQRKLR